MEDVHARHGVLDQPLRLLVARGPQPCVVAVVHPFFAPQQPALEARVHEFGSRNGVSSHARLGQLRRRIPVFVAQRDSDDDDHESIDITQTDDESESDPEPTTSDEEFIATSDSDAEAADDEHEAERGQTLPGP